ncbi:MAG: aminotransferase class I/II-fold pyridoxal phosphate-dependent enzyme [Candidatus Hodarchaeales archaeon]|jgi:O-acetylhomoserine/O-acetylserine sulfhydrylase-like pyridoxal-dependent enzyme
MAQEPIEQAKKNYVQRKITELEEELNKLKSTTCEEDYFRSRSEEKIASRATQMKATKNLQFSTIALHGLYGKEDMDRFKSMVLPVFSTTTGSSYDSLKDGAMLLSYETVNDPNKIYSRIDNTTIDHLAMKIAALEGKNIPELTQGLCVSSGMAAIHLGTLPFLENGDHFVSSSFVYGGTNQLFGVTYPKSGWIVDWVNDPWDLDNWQNQITPKTKFLYVESPSNPLLYVADVPSLAKLAHDHNIPLIIDSTIASPALMRPFEYGADIIVHSLTKVIGSNGRAIGGAIVGKERIVTNMEDLAENFINKLKGGHFRNLGPCLHPPSAATIWDNLSSLEVRLKSMSDKALKIAKFLANHPKVEKVNYPGLSKHPQHEIAKKLLRYVDGTNGFSHLMSFNIKGDLQTTKNFANEFDFGVQVTDLGRDYTTWVHPATTTHGQMTPEQRKSAHIDENMVRYSVGLEGADDAIFALEKALKNI